MPTHDAQPGPNANELALRGWSARLTAWVVGALLLETITGLWIWLAPFSVAAQIQVLLHTLAGLTMLVPCAWYTWSHWQAWRRQTMTAVMLLGYVLLVMLLASFASGLVLTWQAALERRITPLWDLIHLVSSLGSAVVLVVHVPLAWSRRRAVAAKMPALAAAYRRFLVRTGAGVSLVMFASVVLAVFWAQPSPQIPRPADYQVSEHLQTFEEYRDSPFAPTFARTEGGGFIRPEVLSGSASCGTAGCHEEILAEWEPSAHRFSAMNPPFVTVQRRFAEQRGVAEARYCAGCHDPISLFAGARDLHMLGRESPGFDEGCSCVVCHSISKADTRGNADYVLTPPQKYLWEGTTGLRKFVSDFLIRAYPRQHLADYDRNILRTPEFCGACHKQYVPEALNRFGFAPGQNQYEEWRKSHWHHPDDPTTNLSCRDCHMRLVPDSRDPGRGEAGDVRRSPHDGAHRHHGTIATNMFMPELLKLPGWEEHVAKTRAWIRGETVIPEIADLWPEGPVATMRIAGPKKVARKDPLALRVMVQNTKVGHNFSTGPLDFVRVWVHLVVRDATGRVLGEWGNIDPDTRRIQDEPGKEHRFGNPRDQGTLVLESVPVNERGEPLAEHDLWNMAGGKGLRVIFPGYEDHQVYRLTVPADAVGPLRAHADLNFRRYRQEFLDLVVPEMERDAGVFQPTVRQTAADFEIELEDAAGK